MQNKAWSWFLLSLFVAGITSLYSHRILNPWANYVRSQETPLIAEMGDLYSPWVGARELLLYGRNPYSEEVSHKIQMAFYGHPIYQTYGGRSTVLNEQRFAYPVYAVLLMAPTLHADFAQLRLWSAICLGLLTVWSVLLCLNLLDWRPPLLTRIAIGLFVLSCPQIVQGLRLQQLGLLVGFLLSLGAWCVQKNHLVIGGAVLAFSTIKPQMSLLPLCFFLLWVIGKWGERWRLFAAFLLTLGALIGAGELLQPGWIGYFAAGAAAYSKYSPGLTTIFRVLLGNAGSVILDVIILFSLLLIGWRSRKQEAQSEQFAAVFSAFLIATILTFPLFTPFNQVILILPTTLLLRDWNIVPKIPRRVFIVLVGWPWVSILVLLFYKPNLRSLNQLPLLPSALCLFYPLFLALVLMTRRINSRSQPGTTEMRIA